MENYYERPEKNSAIKSKNHEQPNLFAKAAQILGILAIVSALTATIYPPIIFSALAIIMACLSKVSEQMQNTAKLGIRLSIISLAINAVLLFFTMGILMGDGKMHDSLNQSFTEVYGQSFDEIMEEINSGDFDQQEFQKKMFDYLNQ